VFRDPLSILTRQATPAPVAMVAPAFTAHVGVGLRPGSPARLSDGVFEVLGEDLRVPARDVVAIALMPALGGRLALRVAYRKGLDTIEHRCWMPACEHDALRRLVLEVRAASAARA
jgi:hypothetical protein